MSSPKGYLALILHAHLPFVRHPEYEEFLEEDWLYEAITETYIPLINMMDGLINDGVDFRLTMSVTPPLCAMLMDPLLQERYIREIDKLLELCKKELDRTRFDKPFNDLARFYQTRLENCKEVFANKYHRNLVSAFKKFQDLGKLEVITCGATHGYLPLMTEYPESIRAQILIAKDHYIECFGRPPRGIWLPECAYVPGVDKFLQEAEIRWFILDSHGLMFSEPRSRFGIFAPIYTPSGPAAFGRDMESSKQVWSAIEGYPGDPNYRDFYRDVGYDLDFDYIRKYIQSNGMRKFTGLKYHRITGPTQYKEYYNPPVAMERAASHAGNFMHNREKQIDHLNSTLGIPPIVVSPYDAELFGHWWFEGPDFLNFLLRKVAFDQNTFKTITPYEYLEKYPTQQVATPSASSWGNAGYWEVWLEPSNAWIYPHLHTAAQRMTELARSFQWVNGGLHERALKQCARELLLAQSSDWAFIMKTGTMVPYAVKRTKDHVLRFTRLYEQLKANSIDESFLGNCEWRDNIFPNVNWRVYA
ncbi:MAG: glycoside hydrolase family 57 protein [Candidatus Methylacidiphilales bacterium]|nr:1,4-alpha-glucan branching protein domain-containing protein [Candidatus Methylacidiphilales bacterium]